MPSTSKKIILIRDSRPLIHRLNLLIDRLRPSESFQATGQATVPKRKTPTDRSQAKGSNRTSSTRSANEKVTRRKIRNETSKRKLPRIEKPFLGSLNIREYWKQPSCGPKRHKGVFFDRHLSSPHIFFFKRHCKSKLSLPETPECLHFVDFQG